MRLIIQNIPRVAVSLHKAVCPSVLIFWMRETDRRNGIFSPSHVYYAHPRSLGFEITQELQPQTNVEPADVYTRHQLRCVCVEMWVWKLSQDVYTAALDECLLVCQRAACLTSKVSSASLLARALFWHHPRDRFLSALQVWIVENSDTTQWCMQLRGSDSQFHSRWNLMNVINTVIWFVTSTEGPAKQAVCVSPCSCPRHADACVIACIAQSEEDVNNGWFFTPTNTSNQFPSCLFE